MCCASDNLNYICHTCAKDFLNSRLQLSSCRQISNFHDIVPNFTFSQKIVIFQVYLQLFRQLLHPYKFYGRDMSGILASCEPLTAHNWQKWKRVFLTCPCHEVYRVEAVGLKSSNYT